MHSIYILVYILAYIPSLCARARDYGNKISSVFGNDSSRYVFYFCIFVVTVNYSDLIDFYLSSEFFFFFSLDLSLSILE